MTPTPPVQMTTELVASGPVAYKAIVRSALCVALLARILRQKRGGTMIQVFLAILIAFNPTIPANVEVELQGPFESCRTVIIGGEPVEVCADTAYVAEFFVIEGGAYNPGCPELSEVLVLYTGHESRRQTSDIIWELPKRRGIDLAHGDYRVILDGVRWMCITQEGGILQGEDILQPFVFVLEAPK